VFRIPQLIAPGVVEPRSVLPSFLYLPEPDEIAAGGIALPWEPGPSAVVGVLARDRGALAPARQVASAKSWLAHPGVDRHEAFLPWGSTHTAPRISPVDASARYLMHLRDAWIGGTPVFAGQSGCREPPTYGCLLSAGPHLDRHATHRPSMVDGSNPRDPHCVVDR